MPKYRLTVPTFIAPDLIPAGKVILYDGEPSLTFEPLDEAAEEAMAELMKRKPHALVNPLESLRTTGGAPGDVTPMATVVEEETKADEVLNLGTLAQPGKAQPGPSDGGKVLPIGK